MGEEFIVDTSYPGYVFLGSAKGQFLPEGSTEKRPYYNMYVMSPVSTYQSEDYSASGFKAEKKKCLNEEVWSTFKPGDRVKLFFDDKQRVVAAALDE